MLHITFPTFSRSNYANRFLELYYFEHWGVQILRCYFEVFGPEGPNTSKYLDRGNYFRGVHFFVTAHPLRFLLLPKKWTNPQEIDMQTRQSAVSFHLGGLLCAHLHISSWIPSALPTISN